MGLETGVCLTVVVFCTFLAGLGWTDGNGVLARINHCNKTVELYQDVSSPEVTPDTIGKPMTCWWRFKQLPGAKKDTNDSNINILRIRFKKFKVGVLLNATTCFGGYLQIVDGNSRSNVSNRRDPGYFCGESEQPQTFISETSFVKLLFHTDNFTDQTYVSFDSRAEEQYRVHQRFGQYPELYPHRRGLVMQGTYCERVFEKCHLQTCYVQSPAYPGVYPRHLHCRYYLNTLMPFIKLYIENEEFNIDGHRCENIMTCPMRPISSGTKHCPYDYIRIYDGKNESSPVIGTFCGMGKFPYSIIGTASDLFVEFVTSPAGPLLNTGFHFYVGNWPGYVEPVGQKNGVCDWVLDSKALSTSGKSEGIFLSVAHWYPPHTSCTYLLRGEPNQIVRLYFPSFRINRIESPIEPWQGDCGESLTLYDAAWPDDSRIIKTFCDTFSRAMEKHDFVSTGPALFVRFESKTGSYSGSSLYYWAHYDFFNNTQFGEPVAGTACDEVFWSWRSRSGVLRSPLNTLVYKRGASTKAPERAGSPGGALAQQQQQQKQQQQQQQNSQHDQQGQQHQPEHAPPDVKCTYRFITDRRLFARVILTIDTINFKEPPYSSATCRECWADRVDKLLVWEPASGASSSSSSSSSTEVPLQAPTSADSGGMCLCKKALPGGGPLRVVSQGEQMAVQLSVDGMGAATSYFKHTGALFSARYQFMHGPLCGPTLLKAAMDGELLFPHLEALGYAEPPRDIHCIWELQVHRERDLWLRFEKVKFASHDCDDGKLEVFLPNRKWPFLSACGENLTALHKLAPLSSAELAGGAVKIQFTSSTTPARTAFKIAWNELQHMPRNPDGTLMTSRLVESPPTGVQVV